MTGFKAVTELQAARQSLQRQAFDKIGTDANVYLMNMPTGSGKTLASMRCALNRIENSNGRLKRIIYVIPYNSIIDQTAETFERLFSEHTDIIRHQSSFAYEEQYDLSEDYRIAAKAACDNWDAGIIITTAVQFFESLYGDKRGKLRNEILLGAGKLLTTGRFAFCLAGHPELLLHNEPQIKQKWEQIYAAEAEGFDAPSGQCCITGNVEPIESIHTKIKGLPGGSAMGNTMVSFNSPAEESYGKKQSNNSCISGTAMRKYTEALNYDSVSDEMGSIYYKGFSEEEITRFEECLDRIRKNLEEWQKS